MRSSPPKPIPHLNTKLRFSLIATYVGLAALILLFFAWNFLRHSGPNWVVFIAQSLPLAALLPGMLTGYYRSFSWLCFVILIYFVKAVDGALISTAGYLDILFLILTVYIFIAAMLASRWSQRKAKETPYV
ncbi:DUF2069 domain-containing protein [Teredinibacter turnerae]|uniref:DUF2069 domain-containing protein n=1 Tax=Teredinibacter turnerae TaxID=2426 RepID=UPI00035DFF15|nr:DUF2069 domain-containing protein [Teredinibacter turnerae]